MNKLKEVLSMQSTNFSDFRKDMKKYLDRVTYDFDTVIVTRKDNANVVVISEKEYNNLMENQHVLGSRTNREWLEASKEQLEKGKFVEHELLGTEDD